LDGAVEAGIGASLLLFSQLGCAQRRPAADAALSVSVGDASPSPRDPSSVIADPTAIDWASETSSPQRDPDVVLRLPECVAYERPLGRVAAAVADAAARHIGLGDITDVAPLLRAFGEPHVWPRVWLLEGRNLKGEPLLAEWGRWVSREAIAGERRCGTALIHTDDGRDIAVAVVVDALADLSPLPLRVHLGQWLRFDAPLSSTIQAALQGAALMMLAPDGSSRSVPGTLGGGIFHSVFSLDRPGLWRLQASVDTGMGPRPALEAWVFVDRDPDMAAALQPPPGEAPALPIEAGRDELRAALSRSIEGLRRSVGVPPLRRDPKLDDLAQAHVEAMLRTGRTAHDVGDGLPLARAARAGLRARRLGENVARASSLERAHRALWDSPSHRRNLLDAGFEAVGIGVARASAHDIWVCELFADYGTRVTAAPPHPERRAMTGHDEPSMR
jgi:cysteine-rich secretory family protein